MFDASPYYCAAGISDGIPYAGVQRKTALTTTTDETTSTWLSVDIGEAHARRVVTLVCFNAADVAITATINGNAADHTANSATRNLAILSFLVPTGTTCTVAMTGNVGSPRKAVGVFVGYPSSVTPVSNASDSAGTTTNAVASSLTANIGGYLVYGGAQTGAVGAFTTTWSGSDAVSESADAQLEAASTYTFGCIPIFTEDIAGTGTLTLAETVTGTKRIWAATYL
jgi:hypothetical protein